MIKADEPLTHAQHPPDLAAELEGVRELSQLIATEPQAALSHALDLALRLCRAGSARLSLLETNAAGETVLAWTALAGSIAPHSGVLPRDLSPCGLCLDRRDAILISRPGRRFAQLDLVEPPITEALVVPLHDIGQRQLGALWVFSHDEASRFDATDARVLEGLAAQVELALKVAHDAADHARAFDAKDAALRDAHHRTKNTIQVAASMLGLQARRSSSPEARVALKEATSRLGVLAGVHELLHHSADGRQAVGLPALIGTLADGLRQSFPEMAGRVHLRVRVDGVSLDADRAVPLALIVNEAVTNAYKHAFPDGRGGEIAVSLEKTGHDGTGALSLTVRDDGVGLPAKGRDGSLGLKLIQSFGQQLDGDVSVRGEGGEGTTIALRVPFSA